MSVIVKGRRSMLIERLSTNDCRIRRNVGKLNMVKIKLRLRQTVCIFITSRNNLEVNIFFTILAWDKYFSWFLLSYVQLSVKFLCISEKVVYFFPRSMILDCFLLLTFRLEFRLHMQWQMRCHWDCFPVFKQAKMGMSVFRTTYP